MHQRPQLLTSSAQAPRETGDDRPAVSVVMPVYNGARYLDRTLGALSLNRGPSWECILVDDGSTDGSGDVGRRWGMRVSAATRPRGGPGQARNDGAQLARAPLLVFLDADVQARPDTLDSFVRLFAADERLTAAFGSYDAQPDVHEHLSEYRNLLHHFVHQESEEVASTFWAGCGAIRRDAFLAIGGFNPIYQRPSIEDIELGYRLRAVGAEIRLAKHIQVKHLKRWTFFGILKTDIFDRALPWTALIVRSDRLPQDLNLRTSSRISAVSVYGLAALLMLAARRPLALLAALVPLGTLLFLNRALYRFFLVERGSWFLLRALPMHWLYFAYSSLVFGMGSSFGRVATRVSGKRGLSTVPPLRSADAYDAQPASQPAMPVPGLSSA